MVRFLRALLSKPGGDSSVVLTLGVWEEIIACLLKLPLVSLGSERLLSCADVLDAVVQPFSSKG